MAEWMRTTITASLLALFALATPVLAADGAAAAPAAAGDRVWHWYSECAAPVTIKLEVIHRGDLVFATTFPMCHLPSESLTVEAFQRRITFPLSDERLRLFGQPPKTVFTGELVEEQRRPEGLMMRLVFRNGEQSAYTAAMLADPAKVVEVKPAAGVLVRLSPMSP